MRKTAYEIVRAADVARARSLAARGLVEMAREILRSYPGEELPQCVIEVGAYVPRISLTVGRSDATSPLPTPPGRGAPRRPR